MKNNLKKFYISSFLILFIIILILILNIIFIYSNLYDNTKEVYARGSSQTSININYIDNIIWGQGLANKNGNFLRDFIDFIEIENSLFVNMSEYSTTIIESIARMGMLIDFNIGPDNENLNIYESYEILKSNRQIYNERSINLPIDNIIININDYLQKYYDFIYYYNQSLYESGLSLPASSRFFANIFIEFDYNININNSYLATSENINKIILIPLDSDVLNINRNLNSNFYESVSIGYSEYMPILPIIIVSILIFIFILLISIFIFLHKREANPKLREINSILKKYDSEIVSINNNLNLDNFEIIEIDNFDDILKLSTNLNKHISFYKNKEYGAFIIIIDNFAYKHLIKII